METKIEDKNQLKAAKRPENITFLLYFRPSSLKSFDSKFYDYAAVLKIIFRNNEKS